MLVMNDTNVSFNGVCQNEGGTVLASMSASNSGNATYFSLTVEKDDPSVDTDFLEFKKKVLASVASMK